MDVFSILFRRVLASILYLLPGVCLSCRLCLCVYLIVYMYVHSCVRVFLCIHMCVRVRMHAICVSMRVCQLVNDHPANHWIELSGLSKSRLVLCHALPVSRIVPARVPEKEYTNVVTGKCTEVVQVAESKSLKNMLTGHQAVTIQQRMPADPCGGP